MLLIVFNIGSDRFALEAQQILEVIPWVELREFPGAPPYVRGLFNYRGRIVPVIDVSALAGRGSCAELLSTRIILFNYRGKFEAAAVVGLLAEQVTETLTISREDIKASGINLKDSPYWGGIIQNDKGMIQLIEQDELITPQLRDILFSGREYS